MHLRWQPNATASSFYAVLKLSEVGHLMDAELAASLAEPARVLLTRIDQAGISTRRFFDHLIPVSAQESATLDLARTVLSKTLGREQALIGARQLADWLAEIERAFLTHQPRCTEELALREQPIRMQWEARGPGVLYALSRLTEPGFLAENALIVLVHPVSGGGGIAFAPYNTSVFQAVLTDVVPELPEVLRLAWLAAQLNLDLPRFTERLSRTSRETVGPLALIPIVLASGEQAELARCDEVAIRQAISAWLPDRNANPALSATLWRWWQVYRDSRPSVAGGLLALEQMLALAE